MSQSVEFHSTFLIQNLPPDPQTRQTGLLTYAPNTPSHGASDFGLEFDVGCDRYPFGSDVSERIVLSHGEYHDPRT